MDESNTEKSFILPFTKSMCLNFLEIYLTIDTVRVVCVKNWLCTSEPQM
jgi:hypothetical protein